jgi:hypothetical protein
MPTTGWSGHCDGSIPWLGYVAMKDGRQVFTVQRVREVGRLKPRRNLSQLKELGVCREGWQEVRTIAQALRSAA